MAASLSSFDVATCVDRCGFATGCCETHCNGCMNVVWAICFGEEAGARNLVFFRIYCSRSVEERLAANNTTKKKQQKKPRKH